jgi:hypothetical protein
MNSMYVILRVLTKILILSMIIATIKSLNKIMEDTISLYLCALVVIIKIDFTAWILMRDHCKKYILLRNLDIDALSYSAT